MAHSSVGNSTLEHLWKYLGAVDENLRGKTTDEVMMKLIFSVAGMSLRHWRLCWELQTQDQSCISRGGELTAQQGYLQVGRQ